MKTLMLVLTIGNDSPLRLKGELDNFEKPITSLDFLEGRGQDIYAMPKNPTLTQLYQSVTKFGDENYPGKYIILTEIIPERRPSR